MSKVHDYLTRDLVSGQYNFPPAGTLPYTRFKKDLASLDKVRAAFLADRDRRSQEEQDSLTHLFASLQDLDASRSPVLRSLIFHGPTPK
jgi:hypothetical protein